MNKKRIFTLLLALVMVLSLVFAASCTKKKTGNGKDPNGSDSNKNNGTVTEPTLPDETYDGREFRIHMRAGAEREFYVEEDSTNPLTSALYKRNTKVQDTYDVEIVPVTSEGGSGLYAQVDEIIDMFLSGEDTFDLTNTMVVASGGLVTNNVLVNWEDAKYTQLGGSWWLSGANDQFRIYDQVYVAVGASNMTSLRYTYAMMFNETMGDTLKITDDVYDAIDNNEWTMDKFLTFTQDVYSDTDDVSGRSEGDRYGFVAEDLTNLDVYPQAFQLTIISPDEDEGMIYTFPSETLYTAVDKVLNLYNSADSYIFSEAGKEGHQFRLGNSLFATMMIETAIGGGLELMEDVYCILPYPMLDEEQDGYSSGLMDNYTVLGLYYYSDHDFVSGITEALNVEAEKILYPAYYEEALCKKYVTNERYVEMVDIVLEGRRFDLATLFQGQVSRVSMAFRDVCRSGENMMKEYIDSTTDNIEKAIGEIIKSYKEKRK